MAKTKSLSVFYRVVGLPTLFGNWNTASRRFSDWRNADVFKRIFDAVSEAPDMEYAMVDATIVKVHRHGQGVGGPKSGHWSLERRDDHEDPRADRRSG